MFLSKDDLYDLIEIISSETGIAPAIIEKDYYITLFLRELVQRVPDVVFKGGTSLSKCFGIISRFSEDVDLNYGNGEDKPSVGMRRKLKNGILNSAEELGFLYLDGDPEVIPYKRDYLIYHFDYNSNYASPSLRETIMIETSVRSPSYPVALRNVNSLVYQYLSKHEMDLMAEKYGIKPFPIYAQALERTFADKLYAVADYYLENKPERNSRHLYDIFCIIPKITIDEKYMEFLGNLKKLRSTQPNNPSAISSVPLTTLLQSVVDSDFYKKDYECCTRQLLYEDVSYQKVKENLQEIIDKMQRF